MTVLADFPENGIYLDTADEPSARLCRVVRGVLQEEYERLWLVERVFSESDELTVSLSNNLAAERERYVLADERVRLWMAKKNYSTKPYLY